MIGNNKVVLNHATMIEAVNLWLKSHFKEDVCPTATRIEHAYQDNDYTVHLESGEEDAKNTSDTSQVWDHNTEPARRMPGLGQVPKASKEVSVTAER